MTARELTEDLIRRYYVAFNRSGDREAFLTMLDPTVEHDLNNAGREIGVPAFRTFMQRMDRCYYEQITGLVVFASEDGARAAAEFTVLGTYRETDDGLPPASGQTYRLPAGAFFEIRDGRVGRVTMYYNLKEWLRQIGA